MTDVVYILGTGSLWNDNELKYSVRSVLRHVRDLRRIIVVGANPRCQLDTPFVHIPCDDNADFCPQRNQRDKLLRYLKSEYAGDPFLLMDDDFFFLSDVDACSYPLYRQGTLADHIAFREEWEPHGYLQTLKNTRAALLPVASVWDFGGHRPRLVIPALLRSALTNFDWDIPFGYQIPSLYGNLLSTPGFFKPSCQFDLPTDLSEIRRRTVGHDSFSIADAAINKDLHTFLDEKFPETVAL